MIFFVECFSMFSSVLLLYCKCTSDYRGAGLVVTFAETLNPVTTSIFEYHILTALLAYDSLQDTRGLSILVS
jgi:hypothetical protein